MPILEDKNTQTAVIGTEHELFRLTGFKSYVFYAHMLDMEDADEAEVSIYIAMLAGDSISLPSDDFLYIRRGFINDEGGGQPVKQSIPFDSDIECVGTLKQTAGTGRAYKWKVISL